MQWVENSTQHSLSLIACRTALALSFFRSLLVSRVSVFLFFFFAIPNKILSSRTGGSWGSPSRCQRLALRFAPSPFPLLLNLPTMAHPRVQCPTPETPRYAMSDSTNSLPNWRGISQFEFRVLLFDFESLWLCCCMMLLLLFGISIVVSKVEALVVLTIGACWSFNRCYFMCLWIFPNQKIGRDGTFFFFRAPVWAEWDGLRACNLKT